MPPMLLVKNGRVLDPSRGTDAMLDVLLEGDRIAQVAPAISAPSAEVFDATGMVVAPGFIDLRSEEHTSELQSRLHLVCRLLLEKKKNRMLHAHYHAVIRCAVVQLYIE